MRTRTGTSERIGADWRDLALCQGMDTNTFFPAGSAGPILADVTEAKKVCGRCPVQIPCLTFAADQGIDHGIWGGLTEIERRSIKLRRARNRSSIRP
jgi:WhiB family redox-sensing transcriptional regulator